MSLTILAPAPVFVALAVLFGLRLVYIALYRLTCHPLAGVPGPRLAALTRLYEIYYDAALQGQYAYRIGKMHKKYGKAVLLVRH